MNIRDLIKYFCKAIRLKAIFLIIIFLTTISIFTLGGGILLTMSFFFAYILSLFLKTEYQKFKDSEYLKTLPAYPRELYLTQLLTGMIYVFIACGLYWILAKTGVKEILSLNPFTDSRYELLYAGNMFTALLISFVGSLSFTHITKNRSFPGADLIAAGAAVMAGVVSMTAESSYSSLTVHIIPFGELIAPVLILVLTFLGLEFKKSTGRKIKLRLTISTIERILFYFPITLFALWIVMTPVSSLIKLIVPLITDNYPTLIVVIYLFWFVYNDAKRRGLKKKKSILWGLAGFTAIGLPIYLAYRPEGSLGKCKNCAKTRLVGLAKCPFCNQTGTIPKRNPQFIEHLLEKKDAGILLYIILFVFIAGIISNLQFTPLIYRFLPEEKTINYNFEQAALNAKCSPFFQLTSSNGKNTSWNKVTLGTPNFSEFDCQSIDTLFASTKYEFDAEHLEKLFGIRLTGIVSKKSLPKDGFKIQYTSHGYVPRHRVRRVTISILVDERYQNEERNLLMNKLETLSSIDDKVNYLLSLGEPAPYLTFLAHQDNPQVIENLLRQFIKRKYNLKEMNSSEAHQLALKLMHSPSIYYVYAPVVKKREELGRSIPWAENPALTLAYPDLITIALLVENGYGKEIEKVVQLPNNEEIPAPPERQILFSAILSRYDASKSVYLTRIGGMEACCDDEVILAAWAIGKSGDEKIIIGKAAYLLKPYIPRDLKDFLSKTKDLSEHRKSFLQRKRKIPSTFLKCILVATENKDNVKIAAKDFFGNDAVLKILRVCKDDTVKLFFSESKITESANREKLWKKLLKDYPRLQKIWQEVSALKRVGN